MRDIALFAFLMAFLAIGFWRPFLWVLAYIYIDIVAPQLVAWGFLTSLPLSLIVFMAAFGGWLLLDNKQGSRFTIRQAMIVAILGLCALTTQWAEYQDSALVKWDWVWKSLVFAAFLPLTLRTKLRIEAAMLIFVLALGTIVINGGIKTVFGGGGYGTLSLLVDNNTGIYEGSIVSTAAIAAIPMVLFLMRRGTIFPPSKMVTLFAAGLIFSCLLIPVGTSARTGLVCIAVLGALMMRTVRHKTLYAGVAGLALLISIPFLPASFTERMGTITNYQSEQSASTRVEVWKWTVDYALEHPLGGGFDAYRANSFTYDMPQVSGRKNARIIDYVEVTEESRAYHSSYFEMLGEQGWPGLALWLALHGLGIWQMERLRRANAPGKGEAANWRYAMATCLQQSQIIYLVGAAFVGIAYQPFAFMIVGMQCALWAHSRRFGAASVKTDNWGAKRAQARLAT